MRHLLPALCALVATLCLAVAGAPPAFGATLTVSPAELTATLKGPRACGDVIAVTSGVVPKWRPGAPAWNCAADPVVITAADPAAPPIFTEGVTMDGWRGVTWRGVVFDITKGGYAHSAAVLAAGTANAAIGFEGNLFFGISTPTVDATGATELGGLGYGIAGKYQGLHVVGNHFRDLPKGIVLGDSSDVLIADNDMVDITTDNIQFGGLVRGRIERNQLVKKALPDASLAHPDCIQGVKGGRPSVYVVISENLCRGTATGKASQGIFVQDDPANDNITVARNRVLDMGYWAASVQALTAAVNDNVAASQRTTDYAVISWAAAAGEIRGNTAQRFNNLPADSLGNVTAARATADEIEALHAAWLAKFREPAPPVEPAPEPASDPRIADLEDEVAALRGKVALLSGQLDAADRAVGVLSARVDALLAERAKALALAKQARVAKAKNQFIDQLVTLLSAPAP